MKMKRVRYVTLTEVPIDKIDPEYRIRADVKVDVERLKQSIESAGDVIQLPVAFEEDGRYKLIVGFRRLEAYKELGREKIPVLIIESVDRIDAAIISLIENIQRKDPPIEDLRVALSELVEKWQSEELSLSDIEAEVQRTLGVTESTAKGYVALLLLPEEVAEMVAKGDLSKGEAEMIYASRNPDDIEGMIKLAKMVKEGKLIKAQLEVAEQFKDISVEELPEKTKEVAREKVVVLLPLDEVARLKKACKDLGIEREAAVRIALQDWLQRRGY